MEDQDKRASDVAQGGPEWHRWLPALTGCIYSAWAVVNPGDVERAFCVAVAFMCMFIAVKPDAKK